MMGKGDNEQANKILGNCFTALVITALALTAVTMIFCEPLLMMFGASENTIVYAKAYMMIYAAGTIFVQLTLGMNAFISAQGFSRVSMLTVVIGAITNIVLDPVLIFGFHMGVRGAALATVLSQAVSTVWVLQFLSGKKVSSSCIRNISASTPRSCSRRWRWALRRLSCSQRKVC